MRQQVHRDNYGRRRLPTTRYCSFPSCFYPAFSHDGIIYGPDLSLGTDFQHKFGNQHVTSDFQSNSTRLIYNIATQPRLNQQLNTFWVSRVLFYSVAIEFVSKTLVKFCCASERWLSDSMENWFWSRSILTPTSQMINLIRYPPHIMSDRLREYL